MTRRTAAACALALVLAATTAACGPDGRGDAQRAPDGRHAAPDARRSGGARPDSAPSASPSARHTPSASAPGRSAASPKPTGPARSTGPAEGRADGARPPRTSPHGHGAPRLADCGGDRLRWTLTRLHGAARRHAPAALLSAANTGGAPCAFDGYPSLEVYVGKGPSVSAAPASAGRVRLVLLHGRSAQFPLYYPAAPFHGYCALPAHVTPSVAVRPPHPSRTDAGALLTMTDAHGRRVRAVVCGDIRIGTPRVR
ncbi:DUF4232 domain-containing protein [Streptomyces sp. NPDC046985]|uniref:DUF4232 domain-containing protein n=1 Tax=Streptomyces sp. NPDC046985 TaxID=3155377 RepID=UPI0033D98C80